MSAVVLGGGGDEAAHLEAALAPDRGRTDEIQADMTQDGEVVRGVTGAGAHLVIAEDDSARHPICRELPMTVTGKIQKFLIRQKMKAELGLHEQKTA